MSLKPKSPPNLLMTAQRPIPSGGIAESSVSLPDGLTNEQRSLVNDIMALFRQYELDEFANPNRNTARNRLDRFTRVLHDLSFQTIQSVLNDNTVIDNLTSSIAQNVETTDFTSESKSKESSDEKITRKDIQDKVRDTVEEKLRDGSRILESVQEFLKDLIEEEDKSSKSLEDTRKKVEAGSLEQARENRQEKPKEKVPEKPKSKLKQVVERKATSTLEKMGVSAEDAQRAVSKLMAVQKKLTSGKVGSVFKSVINMKGNKFNFKGIVEKTKTSTEGPVFKRIKDISVPRLDKIERNAINAVGKALGSAKSIGKSALSGGAMVLGGLLGGVLGAIAMGVKLIVNITLGAIKAIWGALKFGAKLIVDIGKLIFKSVKAAIVKPIKMANDLLKKKSFWQILTIALLTPAGMWALGFLVGRIIFMIKKYGFLGAIMEGCKGLYGGISSMGKWIWEQIGPTIESFWKKSKENIKRVWNDYLDKHPRIKAINDFIVDIYKKISNLVTSISDWITSKIKAMQEWWNDKLRIVEDQYDDYVKDAEENGDENIMSRKQFLANVIHQDLAAKFNLVMFHINQAWESIQPVVNFVRGIIGFLTEHSWILTTLGLVAAVSKQKTGNNPWSASIMSIMEGVLGYPGLLVGQIISYMVEQVTLWAYNMVKRKQAKLRTTDEVLKSMYGPKFDGAKKEKNTMEKLGKMDASLFDKVDMIDAEGKSITGAEEKRKYVIELFERFSKLMSREMTNADEVVNVFANLRLTSESGKNMDFANDVQDIFAKTGILQTNILPFDFFKVHNFLGITPEKVYKAMDEAKGAKTGKDGKVTSWETSHINFVNRLGMNLVRLKINLLGKIYGNIVRVMDSAKEMGEENALWMLYSYLSPGGALYNNIRKTLLDNSKTDDLLKKLTESWDFTNEGEADMLQKVGTLVDISGLQKLDKMAVNQTRMTERKNYVEKAEGAARQVAMVANQVGGAMDATLRRDTTAGQAFQTAVTVATGGGIVVLQTVAATATAAIMNDKNTNASARIFHYGGTNTDGINLGDVSEATTGSAIQSAINRGQAYEAERYLEETLKKKKVITDPQFAELFYNGFFKDLDIISMDFKNTSKALSIQMEKLKKIEGKITEADMIKSFKEASSGSHLDPKQMEYLAKASYQLYQQDPDQLDKMPEFLESIFSGLHGFVKDRESFWNSKYKGLEPHQVLQEFIKDQMKSSNFTGAQEKFMEEYFQNHYKDASTWLKSAILSKTKLNESLKQQLGEKRAELDRLARRRAERDEEEEEE